jgi:hypothetical protein
MIDFIRLEDYLFVNERLVEGDTSYHMQRYFETQGRHLIRPGILTLPLAKIPLSVAE